jgi:type II secretory ATPase GspE/PulE/Tfp pilus assembly ATPase PilB-like protein
VIADPVELRTRIAKEYAGFGTGDSYPAGARAENFAKGMQDMSLQRANVEELTEALSRDAPRHQADFLTGDPDPRVSENALVRLTNKIIIEAHAQGASDIHIESNAGKANTRIRFRKDGELEDYLELQPAYRGALVSRIKVMANLDISEHRHAQDGKIDFGRYNALQIELRVAVVPTANGMEDVVLRILGGVEPLPLEKLGLSEIDLATIQEMVSRSYGLLLVCGPTGSGKTTTLHSVLHLINRPDIKIWTAEDPVEITQPGLRQVQVNTPIGWTFAAAMRAFLRADPDVIMVGEMRDVETTKIGIEASLTGHLVFSTLHTNSAAESVVRLLELGMDPFNFSDALIGILSQRLARKLCPKCKRARPASEAEILSLAQEYCEGSLQEPSAVIARWRERYANAGPLMLHEAVGCPECRGGLKGRLGVYELLPGSPEVKDIIRSRGSVPQVLEASERSGMHLLRQDAIKKVLEGLLDLPSARSATT